MCAIISLVCEHEDTHPVSLSVGSLRDYVYAWIAENPSKAKLIKLMLIQSKFKSAGRFPFGAEVYTFLVIFQRALGRFEVNGASW